jgi:DNA-binding MarR family transcriptional regulator
MNNRDGNYIHKPLAITRHPQLTFAEQDYLCLIAQLCNRNGCVASNAWFAGYFGVKPPRVSKVISSLAAKGFIKTTEQWNGKKVVKRTIEIVDEDINKLLIRIVTKCYGDSNEMEQKDSNKMGEAKLNIKTKDKSKEMESLFEHFWTAYPKKVSKPQALKAFRKHHPDAAMVDMMLDAIDRQKYSEQWSKNDGQFIPYPATWLSGRRWEDQLDESSNGCCMTREMTEEEADELLRRGGFIK